LHELFELNKKTRRHDIIFGEDRLSYRQLNSRANQLGNYLRSLGIGPDLLVGICVERSIEMVVGILGIMKAGGAYVPLDPAYPQERLNFMLEDAQAAIVLTQKRLLPTLSAVRGRLVCLDSEWDEIGESIEKRSGALRKI
jgi:non-ribosomal peptide synthetase component F